MVDEFVPAAATIAGQQVMIQVQVNEASLAAAAEADPERDVSIWRRKKRDEPFDLAAVGPSITAVAEVVTHAVRKVAPDEAEVEFGLDMGVESGQLTSLLVKGSANATLTIRLLWKRDEGTDPQAPPAATTGP